MADSNRTKKSRAGRINLNKPSNTTKRQRRPIPPPPSASRDTPVTTKAKLPHLQDTLDKTPGVNDKIPTELPPFTPPAIYKPDPSRPLTTLSPGPPPATLPPFTPPVVPAQRAKLPHLQSVSNQQSALNKYTGINESVEETPPATAEKVLESAQDDTRRELEKGDIFDSQEPGSLGCGRHALNNLFGNKYFVKDTSASITDLKQTVTPPVGLQNICKFLSKREPFDKKGDDFCPANENYDINVLAVALGVLGYSATSPGRKWITEKNTDDKELVGYIVNFGESHWVAFRKMQGGKYKLIDSLEKSSEKSEDLDDLKKENKDRIVDILQVKFEGKYVDALKTLLTPATTACKFTRGQEVIYTKDNKPVKCVVNGFHWDDNQKCDALILLPLDPPGDEMLVKDLENVKPIETNSATASVSTPNAKVVTPDSTVATPNTTPNTTPDVTPNTTLATPPVIPTTTPALTATTTPTTAVETVTTTVKTPADTPVSQPVDTSIKPELISRTNKYVRFGFGSESGGVASYFNLSEDNTIFSGSPGINGAESGKIVDFNNRFTDSQEVKDCMLKYWKPSNTLVKKTISEPFEKQFRAPCNEKDIQILRDAFTRYKQFMEDKINMDGKSDAEVADKNQLDRILMYLKKLNEGPNQVGCITPNELVDKEKESITIQSLYYSVLPKLFYLMHKKAKENKGPLNIKPIFDEFENLSNDTSFYLDELRKSGIFKDGDYDGVHGMASSVVELFNLLKVMFPGIYSNGTGPSLSEMPEMPDIDIDAYLGPLLLFLKDANLSKEIIDDIKRAHDHYKQRDSKNALESIGKAFSRLQSYIDKIRQEILTASKPCLNILKLLADTTHATTADEFKEKMLPLMDSPDFMSLPEGDKLNVIMITSKIESLFNEASVSGKVDFPPAPAAQPPLTSIPGEKCPECEKCQPNKCPECEKGACPAPTRESCKTFIDEAKQDLYSKILLHIELAFKTLLPSTTNISKMFDPDTPNPSLQESLNIQLDTSLDSNDINKQKGVLQIDSIINTLEKYLQALNNNYDKWKDIFSKKSDTQSGPTPIPRVKVDPYKLQEQGLRKINSRYTSNVPGYMRSTVAHNSRLSSQGYGSLPSGMEKSKYSGGGNDISFGPDEVIPLIAEQVAWEDMNDRYNSLEPEYKNLLPEPEPAPIHSITEPMHRYIDENADKDTLEEAHNVIDRMNSDEVDDVFTNDDGSINKLNSIYKKALPEVSDKWIPNMVRADVLRNVAKKN
jgi:hypothetical protein